jgi:hypothetical protein
MAAHGIGVGVGVGVGTWYTSINALPVVLFRPDTCAVYDPGARLTSRAESALPDGRANAPVAANAAFT